MKKILMLLLILCLLIAGCKSETGKPATNQTDTFMETTEHGGKTTVTDDTESNLDETQDATANAPTASTQQSDVASSGTAAPPATTAQVESTTPPTAPVTPETTTPPATTTPPETTAPSPTTEPPETTTPPQDTPSSMTKQSYNGLNYWLYTPSNPTANMPLIVYLHGGSGKGEDLELITDVDGFPQYVKDGKIACRAYIIFPQCPSSQKGWKTMGGKIESLISYICSAYNLNTNKVSLTGHSMGGTGTWTLALDKPDLFYKIAPMSGSVTMSDSNLEKLSGIPVWAVVGDKDKIVSPDTSIAMIDALQQTGANAKITVWEGADHFDVPGLGYLSTDVISWLIA